MIRWHRVLLFLLLFAPPIASRSFGYPVKVNFIVLGDPADPADAGVMSTGYFVFDSSIIPYGGGMVWRNYPPGLEFSSLYLNWDAHLWTAGDSYCGILTFAPDGALTDWSIGEKGTPGNVNGGTSDFAIDVHPTSQTFSYSRPGASGVYVGSVVTWDVATLPVIVATWKGESDGFYAIDREGRVYYHGPIATCPTGNIGAASIIGNLFDGPHQGTLVGVDIGNGTFAATFDNGDVWVLCPPFTQGHYYGNLFAAPGIVAVELTPPRSGNAFGLNRPNPFNPSTTLPYTLGESGLVMIRIYDTSGRLVRTLEDGPRPAGAQTAKWDGQDDNGRPVGSGTYFGRITFPDGTTSERKLTVLR